LAKTNLGKENYSAFTKRYVQRILGNSHNAFYERPATISLLPGVNGLSILDAGCGPGIYSAWLIEHGAAVTAMDTTPKFVRMTGERTARKATGVLCKPFLTRSSIPVFILIESLNPNPLQISPENRRMRTFTNS